MQTYKHGGLIMENQEFLKQILEQFKRPIKSQWRVQSYSKTKAFANVMSYIDARDCMDILDSYAIYGWGRDHEEIDGKVYCRVSINMPDGTFQTRSDCGTPSQTEKDKGQASDSFKRACVNFGIGRFLYDLPILKIKTSEVKTPNNYPKFLDAQNNEVKDLNEYCNLLHPANIKPQITAKQLSQAITKIRGGEDQLKDKLISAYNLSDFQVKVLEYEHSELLKFTS